MVEIAADRGYGAVTVRELTRLAGVSTRSFYDNFGEKEECFFSTHDRLVRTAARRMIRSQRVGQDWRERLRLVLRTATQDLAAEPKAARLVLVEVFAAGPAALEPRSHAETVFETVVRTSLNHGPGGIAASRFAARAIVAGATRVVRERLLADRLGEAPELVDGLMEWATSFVGEVPALGGFAARALATLDHGPIENGTPGHRCADERTLLLAATAKLAAKGGYDALSALGIRTVAGVSRRSFDLHFDGVEDCFMETVEHLCTDAISGAVEAGASARVWSTSVHRTVSALCVRLARDPVLSRLVLAEILMPGLRGLRQRERLVGLAARALRDSAPPGARPSRLAAEASTGAAWDVLHHCEARGVSARQAPTLALLILSPAVGGAAAKRTIGGGRGAAGNTSAGASDS